MVDSSSRDALANGMRPGEHLERDHPERVDVAPDVDRRRRSSCSGLMYRGVPTTRPGVVSSCVSRLAAFAIPKSTTFTQSRAVARRLEQDVVRLEIAMHHGLRQLVRRRESGGDLPDDLDRRGAAARPARARGAARAFRPR